MHRFVFIGIYALVTAVLCGGCKGGVDGPPRHHLSGTVQFDGQPVPRGTIALLPDGSKGNNGPSGSAKIVEGKYDTRLEGGLAPVSGPLILRVEGYAAATPNEDIPRPLFPVYQTELTMPEKDHIFDISVPKGKGK